MPLVHSKLVKLTAAVVRQTYIQERSLVDNKPYIPSLKWDGDPDTGAKPIWDKIAEKLLMYGVEPELYVRFYFEQNAVVGGNFAAHYPTNLLSEKVIRNYRENGKAIAEDDLRDALKFQTATATAAFTKERLLRKVDEKQATRTVLRNLNIELSPLFRFCWAASMKLKSFRAIRDRYLPAAAIQYSSDPDSYDKIWGDKLPSNFRTYVTETLGLACKGRYS